MPDTWTLDIDDDPNAPADERPQPGDRWCSLLRPGGRPCRPSIEGTADEWLAIAEAIERNEMRGYKRVAFLPVGKDGSPGRLLSPRNSVSERDHAVLTATELAALVANIRAQLAPPAAPIHPMAEEGSGPTSAPPPAAPARPCCLASRFPPGHHAIDCTARGHAPAPASRPPGVPMLRWPPPSPPGITQAMTPAAVDPLAAADREAARLIEAAGGRIAEQLAAIADQPPPVPNERPAIWPLVIADMQERDRVGRERYGVPLQPFNGRDPLVDAYQEALDLAVYLRQAIEERPRAETLLTARVAELSDLLRRLDRRGGPGGDMHDLIKRTLAQEP